MKIWIAGLAVIGCLASMVALPSEPVGLISQQALIERQQAGDEQLFVLDVRTPDEFASGHVPGAVNVPHDQVAAHLGMIPRDKDVVMYCRSGRRVMRAAEALAANGYTRLLHLDGDMSGWAQNARDTAVPADPAACVAALERGVVSDVACAPL